MPGLVGMTGKSGINLLDYAMDEFFLRPTDPNGNNKLAYTPEGRLKDFYGSGDEEFVEEHHLEFDKKQRLIWCGGGWFFLGVLAKFGVCRAVFCGQVVVEWMEPRKIGKVFCDFL